MSFEAWVTECLVARLSPWNQTSVLMIASPALIPPGAQGRCRRRWGGWWVGEGSAIRVSIVFSYKKAQENKVKV